MKWRCGSLKQGLKQLKVSETRSIRTHTAAHLRRHNLHAKGSGTTVGLVLFLPQMSGLMPWEVPSLLSCNVIHQPDAPPPLLQIQPASARTSAFERLLTCTFISGTQNPQYSWTFPVFSKNSFNTWTRDLRASGRCDHSRTRLGGLHVSSWYQTSPMMTHKEAIFVSILNFSRAYDELKCQFINGKPPQLLLIIYNLLTLKQAKFIQRDAVTYVHSI